MMIAELQQQLQVEKETSQQQAIALSSALEGAAASSRNMEEHNAAAMAVAKAILDQLQMTNESGQSYGNTLVQVTFISPQCFTFRSFSPSTAQVLAGIETEINSLHDLLRATSGTVGASTAATVQLRQLHQVEMHRLQSEIEAQRSLCTHVTADLAAKTEKYEAQVAKLQNDLDRISQAEAAAKQALSHDRCSLSIPPAFFCHVKASCFGSNFSRVCLIFEVSLVLTSVVAHTSSFFCVQREPGSDYGDEQRGHPLHRGFARAVRALLFS